MSAHKFDIGYIHRPSLNLKHLEEQFSPTLEDLVHEYNPFCLNSIQNEQPVHRLFFDVATAIDFESIQLNSNYQMIDLHTVVSVDSSIKLNKPVFIKYSPLLDPVRYMIGKYNVGDEQIRTLPKNGAGFSKLSTIHNASYADGFFSFLASRLLQTHNLKHAIDYYGSYLAVQKQFKMDITDDYDYLTDSDFFNQNLGKIFRVTKQAASEFPSDNSRRNKDKLQISDADEVVMDDIILIDTEPLDAISGGKPLEEVFVKTVEGVDSSSSDSDSDESDSDEDDCSGGEDEEDEYEDDDDGDEDDEDDDDDSSSEENVYAYIDNFPVQMICLEKCHGTLDKLFEDNDIDEEIGASALFQVVMTLLAFDKAFKFTHNDLHTNNIMYINTDIEYLYYKFEGKRYKVPTYGKIFKLIDFGRSIYKFKGKLICSDSFDVGGDASTQYNFPPFYDKKKPRIDPNPSFDLCRLGCSIYDFVIGDKKLTDELQRTIHRWCLDDKGVSVLYKKNGEERYPDFKLYKMIARNVHKHTPKAQLEFPFFKQFLDKEAKDVDDIMDLDGILDYSV
jgi:hypothetical protein